MQNIRNQRLASFSKYGFLGNVDPNTGQVSDLRVDANNPAGLYQQMLRSQSGEMHHAEDLARSRGLTGGYVNAGLGDVRNQENLQSAQLGQQMQGEWSGYDQDIQNAALQKDQAFTDIQHQALIDAITNGQFNPAPVVAPTAPGPLKVAKAASPRKALARRIVKRTVRRK